MGFYTPTVNLNDQIAKSFPDMEPFITAMNKYIRKLEMASLSRNVTVAINAIEEGLKDVEAILPSLEPYPRLYNSIKKAPENAKGLIEQMKKGTRDPRDINTALGIFYYELKSIFFPNEGESLRINLIQPGSLKDLENAPAPNSSMSAKGSTNAKGSMGAKGPSPKW